MLIKHVQEREKEKEFDCKRKRKRTFFYPNFYSVATSKNQRFSMSSLFLELVSILVSSMYFRFLLFANTHDHELMRVKHYETQASTKV